MTAGEMQPRPLTLGESATDNSRYLPLKRGLDLVVAVACIVVFAPLILAIAIAVRVTSPGPILYRQERLGKHGKPFQILKFRSMQVESGPEWQLRPAQRVSTRHKYASALGQSSLRKEDDPPITGLGRYLRRFSLDELPQFLNVLRGEMSVVGPRPLEPYEFELYEEWHKRGPAVRPGITGYWQVFAHSTAALDQRAKLDLEYRRRVNLWLDLRIMMLTPIEMIRGKGTR